MVSPAGAQARYALTYFDPLDEEGMRMKTWRFENREDTWVVCAKV